MSKRANAFIVIAFILFMLAAIVATFLSCDRKDNVSAETPTQSEQATEYKTYVVREYDGMVAVFEKDNNTPLSVTDTYVSSLPDGDIVKLKEGIEVNSEDRLRRLLEDLCS
ncbi:MAG: hypothetical protein U0M12_03635 [Acutalibacteraceae bacterium]|nr:hypothetical protein [Acutalibacteraceae bacterium]